MNYHQFDIPQLDNLCNEVPKKDKVSPNGSWIRLHPTILTESFVFLLFQLVVDCYQLSQTNPGFLFEDKKGKNDVDLETVNNGFVLGSLETPSHAVDITIIVGKVSSSLNAPLVLCWFHKLTTLTMNDETQCALLSLTNWQGQRRNLRFSIKGILVALLNLTQNS